MQCIQRRQKCCDGTARALGRHARTHGVPRLVKNQERSQKKKNARRSAQTRRERTWSPASMPSQGPTWYSHCPGSTSCWCRGLFGGRGGCGWCVLNPSIQPNPARFIRLLPKSTHAVDPGDGDLRVEAGAVVRLGNVPAEGVLEARRAVVGALVGLYGWLV